MRYWVRFLIFDENQSGTGNPVPDGSKLPMYDKHDKLEAGDE